MNILDQFTNNHLSESKTLISNELLENSALSPSAICTLIAFSSEKKFSSVISFDRVAALLGGNWVRGKSGRKLLQNALMSERTIRSAIKELMDKKILSKMDQGYRLHTLSPTWENTKHNKAKGFLAIPQIMIEALSALPCPNIYVTLLYFYARILGMKRTVWKRSSRNITGDLPLSSYSTIVKNIRYLRSQGIIKQMKLGFMHYSFCDHWRENILIIKAKKSVPELKLVDDVNPEVVAHEDLVKNFNKIAAEYIAKEFCKKKLKDPLETKTDTKKSTDIRSSLKGMDYESIKKKVTVEDLKSIFPLDRKYFYPNRKKLTKILSQCPGFSRHTTEELHDVIRILCALVAKHGTYGNESVVRLTAMRYLMAYCPEKGAVLNHFLEKYHAHERDLRGELQAPEAPQRSKSEQGREQTEWKNRTVLDYRERNMDLADEISSLCVASLNQGEYQEFITKFHADPDLDYRPLRAKILRVFKKLRKHYPKRDGSERALSMKNSALDAMIAALSDDPALKCENLRSSYATF